MNPKPEFIIIGAMKSATSTLYDQLVIQPGIFMTIPKEPNYFSDDDVYKLGPKWYGRLFAAAKKTDVLGEASTHYTKLPTYPKTITRMKDSGVRARLIYIMRHPLDRLVSHYIHEWSQGVIHSSLDNAIENYPELIEYSLYSRQLKPFIDEYGKENILPVFFDRLKKYPQKELERICKFIGYSGSPQWNFEVKPSNVSRERIRKFPFYHMLVDSTYATWMRRKFIPQKLRDHIKKELTMQKRPVLNQKQKETLEEIFNQDLSVLGSWLGKELNCSNFSQITKDENLEWKQ